MCELVSCKPKLEQVLFAGLLVSAFATVQAQNVSSMSIDQAEPGFSTNTVESGTRFFFSGYYRHYQVSVLTTNGVLLGETAVIDTWDRAYNGGEFKLPDFTSNDSQVYVGLRVWLSDTTAQGTYTQTLYNTEATNSPPPNNNPPATSNPGFNVPSQGGNDDSGGGIAGPFNRDWFTSRYVRSFYLPEIKSRNSGLGLALDPDGKHFYTSLSPGENTRNSTIARVRIPAANTNEEAEIVARVDVANKFQAGTRLSQSNVVWGFTDAGQIYDLKYHGDQLIGSVREGYDGRGVAVRSHFVVNDPRNLASTSVTGLFNVASSLGSLSRTDGSDAGYVTGLIAAIPDEYQSEFPDFTHIVEGSGGSIILRTNAGPSAYGFNADTFSPVTPLIHRPYGGENVLRYKDYCRSCGGPGADVVFPDNAVYNMNTYVSGMFFIPNLDKVVYIGSTGAVDLDTPGYSDRSAFSSYGDSGLAQDYNRPGQGNHSYQGKYEFQMWVHDVADLVNGESRPENTPDPDVFRFEFGETPLGGDWKFIGGVDMDWDSGLLYILEITAQVNNVPYPNLVHVYRLR